MNLRKKLLSLLIAMVTSTLVMPLSALPQTAKTQTTKTETAKTQTAKTEHMKTQTQTEQTQTTKAQASPPIEWPKEIQHPKGKIVIYQPQIDEWPDYKVVKARSAIAFLPNGETNPHLGIIEMQARTEVDFESRLVNRSPNYEFKFSWRNQRKKCRGAH
jgi:hypothetical protein